MSLLEVKCPMCKGSLWLDPSSGKVVDHKAADQKKLDFGEFVKSQSNRGAKLEDQFKKAKEEQEKRKKELDENFKRAKEHPEELKGDDVQSPFQWD